MSHSANRFGPRYFLGRGRCPECGGSDVGAAGFVHHGPSCSRNPFNRFCEICGLELLPGEKRAVGPPPRHLDCSIDYLAHLDEEHSRG